MRITGIGTNLFTSNYKPAVKTDAKSAFLAALEQKTANKSTEAQKADDMTEAIKALDKSLENAENEKLFEISEILLDWLKDSHNIADMGIQKKGYERTVMADGTIVETSFGGGFSFNEEYNLLLADLHELGLLSDRDMEILNSNFSTLKVINRATMVSGFSRVVDEPFHISFFKNQDWSKDIVGFNTAMSEKYLDVFISNIGKNIFADNPLFPSNNNWYEEAAEVHNRLADILGQIFE